ncbi:hypothetical protein LOC67_09145 [Stieleria sp. JC731]|uniref:peptidoglycan-binding protein n=1 Tax=Pirellulaceae TaxID=2691357 RepID=UPI001E480703|nr:peptidoglycan-binding protein [Stieleria sp. JC731]MCC9600728.1 hypothetical protein [Stieleria sp. JC731]
MAEAWNEKIFKTPPAAPIAIDAYQLASPSLGAIELQSSGSNLPPTVLNRFMPPPRVDVHCHLIEVFDETKRDSDAIRKMYNALLSCGYQTNWKSKIQLKAILDPWIKDACGQRPTTGNNTISFIRFSLSNNTLRAVPYVLGAAMRAPFPFPDLRKHPGYLAPINAIAVPLVLDLSFMALFQDDPELVTGTTEEFAFWFRDVWQSTVQNANRLPNHLNAFFGTKRSVYFSTADEIKIKATLDGTAEIARQSRGALQPFLPIEPRRWCSSVRGNIPNQQFDSIGSYLGAYIYSEKSQADASNSKRGFAGLKFYTRHGWQLSGNNALYGDAIGPELDGVVQEVIDYAEQHDIPITNHHSPGGTPPNGFLIPPKEMVERNQTNVPLPPEYVLDSSSNYAQWLAWIAVAETAYLCEYVERTASPEIWRSILKEKPKMRVNLAHAGSAAAMYAHFYPSNCTLDVELVLNRLLGNTTWNDETIYDFRLSDIEYLLENPLAVQADIFPFVFWSSARLRLHRYCEVIRRRQVPYPPKRFTSNLTQEFGRKWQETLTRETMQCMVDATNQGHDLHSCGDWPPRWDSELSEFIRNCWELSNREFSKLEQHPNWDNWLQNWWSKIFSQANGQKSNWFGAIADLATNHENVYVDFSYATGQRSMLVGLDGQSRSERVIANTAIPTALRWMMSDDKLSRKVMFGSDWFLIEQDLGSADDAWAYFRKCFEVARLDDLAWERFSSLNALEFLNLRNRRDAIKAFVGSGPNRYTAFQSIVSIPEDPSKFVDLLPVVMQKKRSFYGYIEGKEWKYCVGSTEHCSENGRVDAPNIQSSGNEKIILPDGNEVVLNSTGVQSMDDGLLYIGPVTLDLPEPNVEFLSGSVGRGGDNKSTDVKKVQELLAEHLLSPGRFDGQIGDRTTKAIELFQRITFGWEHPDGRVDPGGQTISALSIPATSVKGECVEQVVLDITDECESPVDPGAISIDSTLVRNFLKTLLELWRTVESSREVYSELKSIPQSLEEIESWFRYRIHAKFSVRVIKQRMLLVIETTSSRLIYLRSVLQVSSRWSLKATRNVSWSTAFAGKTKHLTKAVKKNLLFTVATDVMEEFLEEEFSAARFLSTVSYDLAKAVLAALVVEATKLAVAGAIAVGGTAGLVAAAVILVGGAAVVLYLAFADDPVRERVRRNAAPVLDSFVDSLKTDVREIIDTTKWCFANQAQCLLPLYQ